MLPWLELGAQNGNVLAMHMYRLATLSELTPEQMLADPIALEQHRRKALQYLFAAANAGSVTTLQDLADIYRKGILTPADPTLAYAYELAYYENSGPSPLAKSILDSFSENLSDEQRARGRELANHIKRACCG